jgi:hypothetical protein
VGEIRSDQSREEREERGREGQPASEEGGGSCRLLRFLHSNPQSLSLPFAAEVRLAVAPLSPDGPVGEFHHPPAQVSSPVPSPSRLDSVGAGSDLTRAVSLRWTRCGQIPCVSHRIS